MGLGAALYRGEVFHRRTRPKRHELRYRVFWLMLDLSELDQIGLGFRLFSHNRFNLLSLYSRDYGDGSGLYLRDQIKALLSRADIDIGEGSIRLLTMPRVLGYAFNPISLYYCHHRDGRLAAMVYEVNNTFGLRHAYIIPVPPEDQAAGLIRQGAAKALYVSPFMGMDMDYRFLGLAPTDSLNLLIEGVDDEGLLITARMTGRRHDFTDKSLLAAVLSIPWLTLKVTGAIHWEALKLWIKGVRLTKQPSPSAEPVTLQTQSIQSRRPL